MQCNGEESCEKKQWRGSVQECTSSVQAVRIVQAVCKMCASCVQDVCKQCAVCKMCASSVQDVTEWWRWARASLPTFSTPPANIWCSQAAGEMFGAIFGAG